MAHENLCKKKYCLCPLQNFTYEVKNRQIESKRKAFINKCISRSIHGKVPLSSCETKFKLLPQG